MDNILMFIALVFVVTVVLLVTLSMYSRRAPLLGMKNGRLRPCKGRPNCVCSEYEQSGHRYYFIEPISYAQTGLDDQKVWETFKQALANLRAQYIEADETYLRCIFISKIWRFIDDFEARLDTSEKSIHIRSSSRVGYSDRGLNKTRVLKVREEFERLT
jgi:uncharacterized protein (DUF1499 family)